MRKREDNASSTTSHTYNLSERGGDMAKELIIENYIEIDGEDVLMDTLSEEKRAEIAILLQDTAMSYAGYKRVQTPG
ncbi:hypothetical protein [Hungatella sp.]|nr:hypothetical protein [Hungatella sp.]